MNDQPAVERMVRDLSQHAAEQAWDIIRRVANYAPEPNLQMAVIVTTIGRLFADTCKTTVKTMPIESMPRQSLLEFTEQLATALRIETHDAL